MKTTTKLLRAYRNEKKKLAELEKSFDMFMRTNRDNEPARLAYAKTANEAYFKIKASMEAIKTEYCIVRGLNLGLVAV